MNDAINGVTMEALAEMMTKDGELRAKLGEVQGRSEFRSYLASHGLSENAFAHVHNAWLERFRADPTGRLEAKFHMALAQGTQKAHFGDVRDMSQDVQGGITLDTYAQITTAIAKPGADAAAIVARHGLDLPRWQAANAAWMTAMSQDTTHKLSMQYGNLYQKHAGPAFQEQMFEQTAALLASSNAPADVVDEPEEELTPALCLQKMKSPSRNERWRYAYHYARMADLGNVPNKAEAIALVTPHLVEMLEHHDEHTVSDAESAMGKLWDLEVRTDSVRHSATICLNRAKERLATFQAAFAPIQNQAVPERVTLQSRIQDFTSLVNTLEDYLSRDWREGLPGYGGDAGVPNGFPSASTSAAHDPNARVAPRSSPGGGGAKWIVVPLLLAVLGGGAYFLRVLRHTRAASANAARTSETAAARGAASAGAISSVTTTGATARAPAAKDIASASPPPAAPAPAMMATASIAESAIGADSGTPAAPRAAGASKSKAGPKKRAK